MKKLALSIMALVLFITVQAQEKITAKNIISNWTLVALQVPNALYYNFETDSVVLDGDLKIQMEAGGNLPAAIDTIKIQFAGLRNISFAFKADGTGTINDGINPSEEITYTIDEVKGTITTTSLKAGSIDELKAEFVKEFLQLQMGEESGNLIFILRKVK
ncbi:MAG: hypothetical protein ACOYKE_04260 [Ferruginibacter sp.]